MNNVRNTIYYAGFNVCLSLRFIIFKNQELHESRMQWKFDPLADEIYAALEQQIDIEATRPSR